MDQSKLSFNNIESIILYSLIFEGLTKCDNCKFDEDMPSCRINYKITKYPKFLLILFDFGSYQILCNNYLIIKNLCKENLNFNDKDKYKFIGTVTTPCQNHFTFFINKLNIDNIPDSLERNKNYYFDDMEFNGNFQEIENIEKFIIDKDNLFVPYIAVYEKLNISD